MTNDRTRTEFVATEENPYHFLESGLSNIYLVGIRCIAESGKVIPEIPAIKSLTQLIARDLISKPTPLAGDEIRFLRKRLGKKQTDFSRDIGITPETLSRAENEHQSLGESTDKLIRLYYIFTSADDPHLSELGTEIKKVLADWHEAQTPPEKKVAKVTDEEWHLQAA
jgi:transcriptional regulator with XRE-family HTH domain